MPRASLAINIPAALIHQPIVWRLGALFNVVSNIRRARVSGDRGVIELDVDGSAEELEQAQNYLRALHVLEGESSGPVAAPPEEAIHQPNTIHVRLTTVTAAQAGSPVLSRVARDYRVVVHITFAAIDEDGGTIDIAIAGALLEVQRAIAFLHTTGLRVSPTERSVSDQGNL